MLLREFLPAVTFDRVSLMPCHIRVERRWLAWEWKWKQSYIRKRQSLWHRQVLMESLPRCLDRVRLIQGLFFETRKAPVSFCPDLPCAQQLSSQVTTEPRRYTTMSNRCNTPGVWLGVCFLKWNRHCDPPSLLRLVGAISFLFKKS